jgi:hypothetical protein
MFKGTHLIWACMLYVLLLCSCAKQDKPDSVETKVANARAALDKFTTEPKLQAQVDELFQRYGDKERKGIMVPDIPETTPLMRFQDGLKNGEIFGISPKDSEGILAPSHVRIRFGDHSHYDFILIFPTGTDTSEENLSPLLRKVTNNVYLDPNIWH